MKKPTITTIIVIVVLVIAAIIYFVIQGQPSNIPASSGGLLTSDTSQSDAAVSETLYILQQVNSLRIDIAFFSRQSYLGLVDHTKTINSLPVGGREDVFAPVPGLPSLSTQPAVSPAH